MSFILKNLGGDMKLAFFLMITLTPLSLLSAASGAGSGAGDTRPVSPSVAERSSVPFSFTPISTAGNLPLRDDHLTSGLYLCDAKCFDPLDDMTIDDCSQALPKGCFDDPPVGPLAMQVPFVARPLLPVDTGIVRNLPFAKPSLFEVVDELSPAEQKKRDTYFFDRIFEIRMLPNREVLENSLACHIGYVLVLNSTGEDKEVFGYDYYDYRLVKRRFLYRVDTDIYEPAEYVMKHMLPYQEYLILVEKHIAEEDAKGCMARCPVAHWYEKTGMHNVPL